MKPFRVRPEGKANLHVKYIEIPDIPHESELECKGFQNHNFDFYIGQYSQAEYK